MTDRTARLPSVGKPHCLRASSFRVLEPHFRLRNTTAAFFLLYQGITPDNGPWGADARSRCLSSGPSSSLFPPHFPGSINPIDFTMASQTPATPAAHSSLDPQSTTYTSMIGEQDLEAIGAHCQHPYCHVLDFLPFRCESCRGTFCLEHRTETAHSCSKAGEWAKRRAEQANGRLVPGTTANGYNIPSRSTSGAAKPNVTTGTQCSSPTCKTCINTHTAVGVHCDTCRRTYCLKHRLREDHACSTLTPLGARPAGSSSQEKARSALARFKSWGKEKSQSPQTSLFNRLPKPKPSSAAQCLTALNNLKRTAKGPPGSSVTIPPEKRIYLYVEAEPDSPAPAAAAATTKLPKGAFYYDKNWSVGRVLDVAAKSLNVRNVNNVQDIEEQRLRVFHVEGGRVMAFSEKVGEKLTDGDTVVLLRGVGDGGGGG